MFFFTFFQNRDKCCMKVSAHSAVMNWLSFLSSLFTRASALSSNVMFSLLNVMPETTHFSMLYSTRSSCWHYGLLWSKCIKASLWCKTRKNMIMSSYCLHCTNAAQLFKETSMNVYVKKWESQKLSVPPHILEIHRLNIQDESMKLFLHPCIKGKKPCDISERDVDPKVHGYMQSKRWAQHDIHVFVHS
jgi:hypothetical protein